MTRHITKYEGKLVLLGSALGSENPTRKMGRGACSNEWPMEQDGWVPDPWMISGIQIS